MGWFSGPSSSDKGKDHDKHHDKHHGKGKGKGKDKAKNKEKLFYGDSSTDDEPFEEPEEKDTRYMTQLEKRKYIEELAKVSHRRYKQQLKEEGEKFMKEWSLPTYGEATKGDPATGSKPKGKDGNGEGSSSRRK